MNFVDQALFSDFAQRVSVALLHSLWQATIVAAILWLVLWAIPKRNSNWRYGINCAGLLSIFCWFVLTCLLVHPAEKVISKNLTPPAESSIDSAVADPLANIEPSIFESEAFAPDVADESTEIVAVAPELPASAESPVDQKTSWKEKSLLSLSILSPIWLTGVIGISLWRLGGWIALWRLRSLGTIAVPQTIQQLSCQLAEQLNVSSSVSVLQSLLVPTPLVIGFIRPLILLPMTVVTGLPPAQIEAILAHELAHIRRHDYLVNLLQTVIETVLFYHPAVWWVSRSIRREREFCSDDLALSIVGDRVPYAQALAAVAEMQGTSSCLAVAASDGSLLDRIVRVAGQSAPRQPMQTISLPGLMLVLLSLIVLITPLSLNVWSSTNSDADDELEIHRVTLPDVDRRDIKTVLDLVSGEFMDNLARDGDATQFQKLGKGDLWQDGPNAIGTLRGATLQYWNGSEYCPMAPVRESEGFAAYELNALPCKLLVTTVNGQRFVVDVLSKTEDASLEIEYQAINSLPPFEGLYQGEIVGQEVKWRIVNRDGDFFWLKTPDEKSDPDQTKLKLDVDGLVYQDNSKRIRFSRSEESDGMLFETWDRVTSKRTAMIVLSRIESAPADEPPVEEIIDMKNVLWGEAAEGIRLGIRPSPIAKSGSRFRHGDWLRYEVWVKNETDQTIHIPRDPREGKNPVLKDKKVNLLGHGIWASFQIPLEQLENSVLKLEPQQSALLLLGGASQAPVHPLKTKRGRYGPEPLRLAPGTYPCMAELDLYFLPGGGFQGSRVDDKGNVTVEFEGKNVHLESAATEIQVLPAAPLQIRQARQVVEAADRAAAAQDASREIIEWTSADGQEIELTMNMNSEVVIDGDDVISAKAQPADDDPNRYDIVLSLTPAAAERLHRVTSEMVLRGGPDSVLAIQLNDKVLFAPKVQAAFRSKAMISGDFNKQEAEEMARSIKATADPVFKVGGKHKESGVIRGNVILDTDAPGIPANYVVLLEHELWRNNSGEIPNLVVAAGHSFEFTNVPVGECAVQIMLNAENNPQPTIEDEIDVTVKHQQTVDLEFAEGEWRLEREWGKSVEGVQVRLHSPNASWGDNEWSLVFKTDLRSTTERVLPFYGAPIDEFFLEFDGHWYETKGRGFEVSRSVAPSAGTLRENMHTLIAARQWRSLSTGKPMPAFTEGHHIVRVALPLADEPDDSGRRPRAVSQAVEIEIIPKEMNADVSIDGKVIGIDGKPAIGYRVTALCEKHAGSMGWPPTVSTDQKGKFVFHKLPDGSCDVAVTSNSRTNQPNIRIESVVLKKAIRLMSSYLWNRNFRSAGNLRALRENRSPTAMC